MNRRHFCAALLALATCPASAVPDSDAAGVVATLAPYAPEARVSGLIRLWGHGSPKRDFMGKLVRRWAELFRRHQPAVGFDYRLYGTASAVGALYTGAGNLAILGEEISPAAVTAFERAKHYPPTVIDIATGSLDTNYFDYAHMIFVHRDNPIESLTLSQLEAIFGTEHRRAARNLRRWGEIGLGGEWAQQHIQPYGWKVDEDFALFFRAIVLEGSHRWNPDLKEFMTIERPDGSTYDRGQQILDALAHDRYGIAISNRRFANSQVKPLALCASDDGAPVEATTANLISQRYPLTRIIPAVIDRTPGRPADPVVREFLRLVLSSEGQQALVENSGYLPLNAEAISAQLEKLR
jgi:phosphate transport system substrate-binding protein